MSLFRGAILISIVLVALLAPPVARAALRADQDAFLAQINTQYAIPEWIDAPSCNWAGVTCCLAGDTDCDPTDDLIRAMCVEETFVFYKKPHKYQYYTYIL